MANYTQDDIQEALNNGLITEQDAQYLSQALEPGPPIGGIVGGILGGTALGVAGSKIGKKVGERWLNKATSSGMPEEVVDIIQKNPPKTGLAGAIKDAEAGLYGPNIEDVGGLSDAAIKHLRDAAGRMNAKSDEALGGIIGTIGGSTLGFTGGNAAFPNEGQGVEGQAVLNPNTNTVYAQRDFLLRMLLDPEVPPEMKQKALDQIKQYDEQNPPSEMRYGAGSPVGGILGGLAGGALGGGAGYKLGGALGAGLGGVGGAALGGLAGNAIAPARPSPYEDPLT